MENGLSMQCAPRMDDALDCQSISAILLSVGIDMSRNHDNRRTDRGLGTSRCKARLTEYGKDPDAGLRRSAMDKPW